MSQHARMFTIGVEEEFQIVDPVTRELSADAEHILPGAQELLGEAVQYELILSQLEVATPICSTLDEVQQELTRLRRGVIAAASQVGKRIAAAGTHPFSHWREQQVTPKEHYQRLVEDYQQLIREQVIFGCHVHVGIPDRHLGAQVLSHARLWLAPLLVLTANSPFWLGTETGYDSYRTSLWWTVPLSGPPPYLASHAVHQDIIQMLITTKSIEDVSRIYWDIRLPERFKTIEFRVMDVCMTVREAVLAAGLVRGLVRTCYELAEREEVASDVSTELLRLANWRAARYGLDAELIDVQRQCTIPAREYVGRFLEFVRPALEAEGDWQMVTSAVEHLLHHGNGAQRQRNAYRKRGQISDVVDFVIAETESF